MPTRHRHTAVIALLGAALAMPIAHAQAGIEAGLLTCTVVPGSRINLVVRSTADLECTYSRGDVSENYVGETGIALGLDLSFKQNERMAFTVFAATQDITPGTWALAGRFVGGEVSAAAGLGLGAKALFGGGARNIGLQPIALESSTGVGAAGGLSFLYLEPGKPPQP